jgi:hypothetical protein
MKERSKYIKVRVPLMEEGMRQVSICDICVKQKISVINKTKQDKILLKLKVLEQEKLSSIL